MIKKYKENYSEIVVLKNKNCVSFATTSLLFRKRTKQGIRMVAFRSKRDFCEKADLNPIFSY